MAEDAPAGLIEEEVVVDDALRLERGGQFRPDRGVAAAVFVGHAFTHVEHEGADVIAGPVAHEAILCSAAD
jgi:hypothetical protein